MGTTIAALRIVGDAYEVAWVGDSRIYLWQHTLRRVSDDHWLVQAPVAAGQLDPAHAAQHPQRNLLTQALGVTATEQLLIGMFFFSSRRRHTSWTGDWSSDVCSSDLTCASARRCSAPRSWSSGPPASTAPGSTGGRWPWPRSDGCSTSRAPAPAPGWSSAPSKIGRASCRGRVGITEADDVLHVDVRDR